MRTAQYLKNRNIGISTLEIICNFLNVDCPDINQKLTETQIKSFDTPITQSEFEKLYKSKIQFINEALSEIKFLLQSPEIIIDELDKMKIVIDNINILIKHNYFRRERKSKFINILNTTADIKEQVDLIRKQFLDLKKNKDSHKNIDLNVKKGAFFEDKVVFFNDDNSWISAYGNSYEAYIAHWNTD
jgi:hypothetical protein